MKRTLSVISNQLLNAVVDVLVLLGLLIAFFYAAYALWDVNTIYAHAEAGNFTEYKPVGESPETQLSFQELQAMNPDVVAWLTIYGTAIDYPLVQGEDNFCYLDRTVKGDYSAAGSLFLDYRNNPDFSDWNTIIHGHHMAARAMFGDIGLFEDERHFEEHRYGDLFVQGKHYGVEIFRLVLTDTADHLLFQPAITDAESQAAYLSRAAELTRHSREIKLAPDERILVLATCSELKTNGRHMLFCRISSQTFANPFPEEKTKDDAMKNRQGLAALLSTAEDDRPTHLLLLLGLIFFLLLLAYLLVRQRLEQIKKRELNYAYPVYPRTRGYGQPGRLQGEVQPNGRYTLRACLPFFFLAGILIASLGISNFTSSGIPGFGGAVVMAEELPAAYGKAAPVQYKERGVETSIRLQHTVGSKYYNQAPPADSRIHYELLALDDDAPLPNGASNGVAELILRVGDGDAGQDFWQAAAFPAITLTGDPPQEYRYRLHALRASGPSSNSLKLDSSTYTITLKMVKSGGQIKALFVVSGPQGKAEEILFRHAYVPRSVAPPTLSQRQDGSGPIPTLPQSKKEPVRKGILPATGEWQAFPWAICLSSFLFILLFFLRQKANRSNQTELQGEAVMKMERPDDGASNETAEQEVNKMKDQDYA